MTEITRSNVAERLLELAKLPLYHYHCGQCGLDEWMFSNQITSHWRRCVLPLLEQWRL